MITAEQIMALKNIENILSEMEATRPNVEPFEIKRDPVLRNIVSENDEKEFVKGISEPKILTLTRALKPLTLDVAELSRRISDTDDGANKIYGENDEEASGDEYFGDSASVEDDGF